MKEHALWSYYLDRIAFGKKRWPTAVGTNRDTEKGIERFGEQLFVATKTKSSSWNTVKSRLQENRIQINHNLLVVFTVTQLLSEIGHIQ